jgi:hypothetical protein
MFAGTGALVAGCGAESEAPALDETSSSAPSSEEAVSHDDEAGTVTAAACTHNSTRWVGDGCCTQTATRRRQEICIYGTWYWTNVYECYYPTSYCL